MFRGVTFLMIDDKTMFGYAQTALEDLARATGIEYSATPKVGAISLLSEVNKNVYAMKVTGLDADGNVERGVTPFGDPPMTAREFANAAALAEGAVYALYRFRPNGRIDAETQAIASRKEADAANESDPQQKARILLNALVEEVGARPMRIVENQLGLVSIESPSPFGSSPMTIGQLAAALSFALNAIYHHNRTRA